MKVGDYVRTKDGIILKIKDIEDIYTTDNEYIGMAIYDNKGHFVNDVEIIKSSPNIIDLIEVGDYVNGEKVIRLFNPTFLSIGELPYAITDKNKYEPQEIENVVTKQQFSQMEYKVGE